MYVYSEAFRKYVTVAAFLSLVTVVGGVRAQDQIKPRILIVFDTSTSMLLDISADTEVYTNGDGSWDRWGTSRSCCGGTGNSRMYAAKEAMRQMVEATGDIEFSLMKYAQEYASSPDVDGNWGWTDDDDEIPIIDYIKYRNNQNASGDDRIRYRSWWFNGTCYPSFANYEGTVGSLDTQWLCAEFPTAGEDNRDEVLMWMDHHEYSPDGTGEPDDSPLGMGRVDDYEQELRAAGSTPLAASMYSAEQYLKAVYASDWSQDNGLTASCRPYSVILLTDGDESCGGVPTTAATSLHTLEGTGGADKEVQIFVIGLNVNSTELDAIAAAGGTGSAYAADSQDALSAVLYEIISGSLLVETCNGADDDCDGVVDEDFTLYCDKCNGHEAQDMCVRPTECNCDGIDDNCDGAIDEPPDGSTTWPPERNACGGCDNTGSVNTACGNPDEGRCDRGDLVCSPGVGLECVGSVGPVEETCNEIDDDCDGETDEDIVGDECGACGDGNWYCVGGETVCCGAGSTATDCVPVKKQTVETCNGEDDDCDGSTDENVLRPCGGCDDASCGDPNEGICAQGREECENATWGSCEGEIGPTTEICDLLDNDCDGETDEDIVGASCGACDDGNWYCVGGGEQCCSGLEMDGTCIPVQVPTQESCNGEDDDCDGLTDEDIPPRECPASGYEAYFGIGVCSKGYEICRDSLWGNVNPTTGNWEEAYCLGMQLPGDEVCNNLDDDCDGETDEGTSGAEGCGPCGDGKEECINGILQCTEATAPIAEVCNGVDDNCNGLTDEGMALSCGGCTAVAEADGGIAEAYEDCLAAQAADTGIGPGEGECQEGARFCDPAAEDLWGECQGGIGPSSERCDGKDNDCDGETDEEEEIENVNENCATEVGICEEGWWRCVDDGAGAKSLECCKEVRDDGTCVVPQGPAVESCDGIDNDCDGETDEELPNTGESCGIDLGVCDPGTIECVCGEAGNPESCKLECVGGTAGTDEICNGIDDDCDGETDEDIPLGNECTNAPGDVPTGECDMGFEECINGEYVCNANEPTDEICDGLDNDCDGETDENLAVECPGGSICQEGECAPICVGQELQCPPGLVCVNMTTDSGDSIRICTTDVCRKGSETALPCVENPYWCDEGNDPLCKCSQSQKKCISVCAEVLCPDGKACVAKTGQCQPITDECYASGCPEGEVCHGGECVEDPCPATCPEGEYCNGEGDCVESCVDIDCPVRCFEGKCVDLCDGVSCESGEVCNDVTGKCEAIGACDGVQCKYYEVCQGGECIEDPCFSIKCPNGFKCETGTCIGTGVETGPDTDSEGEKDTSDTDGDSAGGDTDKGDTDGADTEDNSYGMDRVLATGMGGCLCSTTPGAAPNPGSLWLLGLGLLGLGLRMTVRRFAAVKVAMLGMWVLGILLMLGCTTEPYVFNQGGEGKDSNSGGGKDSDQDTSSGNGDGDADTDTDTNRDSEGCVSGDPDDDCDGLDDDCDGETDEGVNLQTSSQYCGSCDNDCRENYENAFGMCASGQCEMGECAPFYQDLNGKDSDGCEYYCQKRADKDRCNGVDLGDGSYKGLDDDCDGEIDEEADLKLQTDVYNCGRCGHVCQAPHVEMKCVAGECVYDGSVDCDENFHDLNGEATDGCEYACEKRSDEETLCDKKDDNCDGETDEGNPQSGGACYELSGGCTVAGGVVTCPENSRCTAGEWTCQNGTRVCEGQMGPLPMESCNGIDDNCNGRVDENLVQSCSTGGADFQEVGVCRKGFRLCEDGVFNEEVCEGEMLPSAEVCDGFDNDCDGLTDEAEDGGPLVGESCGKCGGLEFCISGQKYCCLALDADGGCVEVKAPSTEVCNGFDDDCDGLTDNNLPMALCDGDDADLCTEGVVTCEGGAVGCSDATGDNVEICDALDNDCDGQTDEEDPDLAAPSADLCRTSCGAAFLGTECMGAAGWRCNYDCAAVQCNALGQVVPAETLCDGEDNDCDGQTDENLLSTANNCGGCGNTCELVQGNHVLSMVCVSEECRVNECEAGYHNLDGDESCEYGPCDVTGTENETCDGIDNDCNGLTDEFAATTEVCDGVDNDCDGETDEGMSAPDICNSKCPTSSAQVTCDGAAGWQCHYDCGVVDCEGGDDTVVANGETRCDGVDNNCDGTADEGFELWNSGSSFNARCDNGGIGACRGQGYVKCAPTGDAYACCATSGQTVCAAPNVIEQTIAAGTENATPNGLDEDCDGLTDEGATGCAETVHITNGSASYDIFKYEASRAVSGGKAVCAVDGVTPWTNVTFADARSACQLLNDPDDGCSGTDCWDLCDASQWFYSCAYPSGALEAYPYGDTYNGATCNGQDYSGTTDALINTGAATQCIAEWIADDVWDLSGNAQEWTLGQRDTLRVIRGGSFKDVAAGMKCNNDFFAAAETGFQMNQIGFRCCKGAAPVTECAVAIDHIPGYPFDFDNNGSCAIQGFVLKGEFEVGNVTGGTPALRDGCLIGTNLDGAYGVNIRNSATSPQMNLTACAAAADGVQLSWDMSFDTGTNDTLRLLVSNDAGDTWYRMNTYSADATAWTTYTQDVTAYANSDEFMIKFIFDSDAAGTGRGVYIDNINIQRFTASGTPPEGTEDTDVQDDNGGDDESCGTTLTAVIRDFPPDSGATPGGHDLCSAFNPATPPPWTCHPDFEITGITDVCLNIVQATLPLVSTSGGVSVYGNPVLSGTNTNSCFTALMSNAANFATWYSFADAAGDYTLTEILNLTGPDANGTYTYVDNTFFPIDDPSFGYGFYTGSGATNSFHFTTEINTYFIYHAGQTFAFTGDDDVWVFIDGHLVVDVGGIHGVRYGRVTMTGTGGAMTAFTELDTNGDGTTAIDTSYTQNLGLVDGYIYALDVYHAERHVTGSNFRIDTNLCVQNVD